MMCCLRRKLPLFLLAALATSAAENPSSEARYLPFSQAQPIIRALPEAIPSELKGRSEAELAAMWPEWAKKRDAETRARLALGEEDSLANLLLFGTSFTHQPRLTPQMLSALQGNTEEEKSVIQGRVKDLVLGLSSPEKNERLQFMRHFLE